MIKCIQPRRRKLTEMSCEISSCVDSNRKLCLLNWTSDRIRCLTSPAPCGKDDDQCMLRETWSRIKESRKVIINYCWHSIIKAYEVDNGTVWHDRWEFNSFHDTSSSSCMACKLLGLEHSSEWHELAHINDTTACCVCAEKMWCKSHNIFRRILWVMDRQQQSWIFFAELEWMEQIATGNDEIEVRPVRFWVKVFFFDSFSCMCARSRSAGDGICLANKQLDSASVVVDISTKRVKLEKGSTTIFSLF